MLEEDTKNVEVLAVDVQRSPFTQTGRDPLRFTPSRRMFLQENFLKDETLTKKGVSSCKRSNSKILKKKRHKDKLKLFKLDKHLWDPAMQLPQLGKSAKYLKKKDKLADNVRMRGMIPGKEKSCIGSSNQIWSCHQPKPLEYTFDILCLTDNVSHPPLMKEPEETLGNDLLTTSSFSQGLMPEPKAGVTNRIFMGDLIDLGTPKPAFKSNVGPYDSQPSLPCMEKVEQLDEVNNSNPPQSSLSPSLINLVGACSLDVELSLQTQIISKVKSWGSGESEDKSASNTAQITEGPNDSIQQNLGFELDDQHQSDISKVVSDSNGLDKRDSSPLVFYGFPGLNFPIGDIKKQQLTSSHPREMLVDHLDKNPFPKSVREKAKVCVRRRAFSMDDTLIESLACKPLEELIGPECSLEVNQAEESINGDAPCLQPSDLDSSIQNSIDPIENTKQSAPDDESNTAAITNQSTYEQRFSISNEIVLYGSDSSKDATLESNTDIAIGDDKGTNISSNVSPAVGDCLISDNESTPIVVSEFSNDHISKGDFIESIPENSLDSPIAEERANHIIESSTEADDFGLTSDSASDNTLQTDQFNPLTGNLTCIKEICEGRGENQPPKPAAINGIGDLGNGRISTLQLQDSSPDSEQKTSDGIVNTSETGFLANSTVNGSDHREILPRNVLDQTPSPTLSASDKNKLPESLVSDVKVSIDTNSRKLDADDNLDVMNEDSHLTPTSDSTLILLPAADQETSKALGTAMSSPRRSNTEDLNVERDLEPHVDHNLVNISAGVEVPNTRIEECQENIAVAIPTPEKLITLSTSGTFEDSDEDSIFDDQSCMTPLEHWVLPPGKKYRRSLSIIRNLDEHPSAYARRGRHYEKSVEEIIRLQGSNVEARTPVQSIRKRLSMRRSSWMRQITPPPVRRKTFIWSPTMPDRGTLYETPHPRRSIYSTPMQQNLVHRLSFRTSPMYGPRRLMLSPLNQDCTPASPIQYTIRDLILTICKQTEPCSFSDILNEESYEDGSKLGEGVFGEVFSINRDGQNTVLKIIPIEGQQLVNGEKQKTYQEVLSELVIAKVLDELRYEGSDEANETSGYAQLIATSLVQGSYPETLLQFWEEFDQTKGSDNENPKMFDNDQLFIVMEQGNGGKDLESYTFSSAKQSLSIFKQVAFSLAVAEISVEFEHRDLHWGNILVSKTSEKQILYTLNGTQYSVASNGVKCTIIDYTLSRIKYINQVPIYNDIGKDPEMFIATGDYQFDIYRFMKKDVEDDWSRFAPKTNARWLHYLLDKMLTKVKYQRKTAKVHKDGFKVLEEIGTWVQDCASALSIALRLAESKH